MAKSKKCKNCGKLIGPWKDYCFECYHKNVIGDYKPNKLQRRFGGTK